MMMMAMTIVMMNNIAQRHKMILNLKLLSNQFKTVNRTSYLRQSHMQKSGQGSYRISIHEL